MRIIGMSGSLRVGSLNTALLRAAVALAPPTLGIEVATIKGIPLYNGDVEQAAGLPSEVEALKERIANADGLLLVTPEYNGSIPGVFKNAIDWLSRPASDIGRVFGGKPVGLIGASPGRLGTVNAQTAWLQVFRVLGVDPFLGKTAFVSGAGQIFDDQLVLVDDTVKRVLTDYLAGFASFVEPRLKR